MKKIILILCFCIFADKGDTIHLNRKWILDNTSVGNTYYLSMLQYHLFQVTKDWAFYSYRSEFGVSNAKYIALNLSAIDKEERYSNSYLLDAANIIVELGTTEVELIDGFLHPVTLYIIKE